MLDLLISVLPTLPMILPMGVDITPNDDVLPGISQLHTIVGAVMARTHCVKTTTSTRHGHIEYAEFRRLPLPAIRCRARTWAQNTPGFQRKPGVEIVEMGGIETKAPNRAENGRTDRSAPLQRH